MASCHPVSILHILISPRVFTFRVPRSHFLHCTCWEFMWLPSCDMQWQAALQNKHKDLRTHVQNSACKSSGRPVVSPRLPKINPTCDSSVSIALGYGLDDRGSRVRFPARAGNFSLHHRVQNGSGAQPASYQMGTRGSFPGLKRPGREADHSTPSSAEVKEWVELYFHSSNTPSWLGA
jgi:hypothetical protein